MIRTAGQAAEELIRERIISGELPPGAALNQEELAREFGMSRIPIRDALRSLASEGLVQLRAHATASVTPLSIADLQELYEIRIALEPMLSRLALPELTLDHFAAMAASLAEMKGADDTAVWLRANNSFHQQMYAAAGRPRSEEIIRRARQQTARYTRIYYELDFQVADLEHEMILAAARHGQADRLAALVTAHLSAGYETMLRYLDDELPEATGDRPLARSIGKEGREA